MHKRETTNRLRNLQKIRTEENNQETDTYKLYLILAKDSAKPKQISIMLPKILSYYATLV